MESCSKELSLAIRLTKILSVIIIQGKENITANPTREFFEEVKEHLGSEVPAQVLVKTLYFLHRVTQKSYAQLLVTEQEYAIWLALHVLERNTWCKPLIFKSAQLALKVLANLSLYLQHQELITEEERLSWQRCEKLISLTFLFIHKSQPFLPLECPTFLEHSFPACFISGVPDDFTMSSMESNLPSHPFELFDESYGAAKIFLNYILQVLRQTPYPTPLVGTLLSLLSSCPRIPDTDLFVTVLEAFRAWTLTSQDYGLWGRMAISFGKIPIAIIPNAQKLVLHMLSSLIETNEKHFMEKNCDLLPEEVLVDICYVIVENLQNYQESPKQPQNVNIAGFGKEKYEDEDKTTEEFCSYNQTGTNYEMQHWYYCYTCKLVANRGTCSVCARKCHKGHEVVYSRRGNFFCDCGANQGANTCKSMPKGIKRKILSTRIMNREEIDSAYSDIPPVELREILGRDNYFVGESRTRLSEMQMPTLMFSPSMGQSMINFEEYSPDLPEFSISSPVIDLPSEDNHTDSEDKKDFEDLEDDDDDKEDSMIEMDIEESESELGPSSKSSVEIKKPKARPAPHKRQYLEGNSFFSIIELVKRTLARFADLREPYGNFFSRKPLESSRNLSKHLCTFKAFSGLKSSFNEHKELKDISSKYPGSRSSLAYCPDLNLILMAEGNKLLSVDSSLFHTTSSEVERSNIQYLCKHVFSFQIMSIILNPNNNRLIAVTGISSMSCVLLCSKQHRGYIEKKLTLTITGSETKDVIVKVKWMPKSQTLIAVCTIEDLRIYDLSKDLLVPLQCFKSFENDLTDMVVDNDVFLLSTSKGNLFRQKFFVCDYTIYLKDLFELPGAYADMMQRIISIEWLDMHRLLIVNISGKIIVIKPDNELVRSVYDMTLDISVDPNLSSHTCGIANVIPLGLNMEAINDHSQGVNLNEEFSLVCVGISRKVSSCPMLLKISEHKAIVHSLKKSTGYVDGMCLYSQGNKNILLIQNDDASLVMYSILKEEDVAVGNLDLEGINNWLQTSYLPKSVSMSVAFFEKCIVLNGMRMWGVPGVNKNEVLISGDPVVVFGNSKQALEKLSFDKGSENTGIISSMLADPKCINIQVSLEGTSANTLLLSGFKLYMETGSGAYIEIFNRKITALAQKRWYDIALCEIEILKGYLNKFINVKIHTPNPARHPIQLFHFEIFAINQSGYGLEQKLSELNKFHSGSSSLCNLPSYYKQQTWKTKYQMLESFSLKPLVVYLNALSCTNISQIPSLYDIISRVCLQVFSSKSTVGIIALRQSLKSLLQTCGHEDAYIGSKALVMCWTLTNYKVHNEEISKSTLKALNNLAEASPVMFNYILSCYPQILTSLHQGLTPTSKAKYMEEYLNLLFAVTEYEISNQGMEIFIDLLTNYSFFFKEQVISKTYAIVKKISGDKTMYKACEIFPPSNDIAIQLGTVFNIKEMKDAKSHSMDLLYYILCSLCKDWSGHLCRVNGILSLLHKFVVFLEKMWVKKELKDLRYFNTIAKAVMNELKLISCASESQGRLYFIMFSNLLTSYYRPKEEKYSKVRKLHKIVVAAFVSCFDVDVLDIVYWKLREMLQRFRNREGSMIAEYYHEFLVEVVEVHPQARLLEPEDPLLLKEWEGVLGSEIFEQENDQFLIIDLIDFAYNLISVSEAENENINFETLNFTINSDWKQLLIDMILEPSLNFIVAPLEKLLERMCPNQKSYLLILYQAKIFKHFSTIRTATQRNNFFKKFSYIESIFLLKELIGIKDAITASEDAWEEISLFYVQDPGYIQMLINTALNLNDQASEECLRIVNMILKTQNPTKPEEYQACVNFLWENYLETAVPVLISKLTLSGNTELSKNAAELLNNISIKASGEVSKKLEEMMLHYLEVLPNLGANSYHFIMNFMSIASKSLHSENLQMSFCRGVIRGLENSCKQLSSNIDYEIYEELQKIFSKYGFHWFLLEREPCLKCFDTNYTNSEQVKLADIQSETRYSDCCYFIRFKSPIKVSRISIKLSEIRGHKAVTGVSIYFCNQTNKDLADLKNNWAVWSILKTVKIKPASTNSLDIDLPIPTIMLNLVVKFHTITVIRLNQEDFPQFYSSRYLSRRNQYSLLGSKKTDSKGDVVGVSMGSDKELMCCPRCNKAVEDKYGICTCGENAYQCLKCRNINYENLDAFLCNECGEGRYSKIDIFLKYTLDAICESINNDKDLQSLNKEVDNHLGVIQNYYENLTKYRENLNSFIGKYKGESSKKELKEESNKELSPVIYCLINTVKEYQDSYYAMMISVKSVALLRTSIMNYQNLSPALATSEDSLTNCYGCNFSFVCNLLKGLKSLDNFELLDILIEKFNIIETIVQYIIHGYSQKLKKKGRKLIIELTLFNFAACERLYDIINMHLNSAIQYESFLENSVLEEIQIVLDFTCQYFSMEIDPVDDYSMAIWNIALSEFWKIFFIILEKSWEDSKVSNILALFLDIILDMIFKTLILKPSFSLPSDPSLQEFFTNNPALLKSSESETNSNALFLKSLHSSNLPGLFDSWQEGHLTFETWSSPGDSTQAQIPHNWLMDCLLYSTSARVQDMSRMIIFCLASSGLWESCLYLMLDLLPEALQICHQGADYFFTVLSRLLEGHNTNHEEIIDKLLKETDRSVVFLLEQQVKAQARGTFVVNISLGHGLVCLLHMLTSITDLWGKHLLRSKRFANYIINAFLNARKIQFIKNKVIAESQEFLEKLFDQLHLDCSEEQRYTFLIECIKALGQRQDDPLAQMFLIQQITRIIAPAKPEPQYLLRLEKSMTQEEYIRGNIEKNPYSSSEIGPLMADVRRRICKDLELSEPDILELLVANQIVSPTLRIADVYEYIHWPHVKNSNSKFANKNLHDLSMEELPQMIVTFRLAGLDGEATEDIIDTLPVNENKIVDPEVKYKITEILGKDIENTSVISYTLQLLAKGGNPELCEHVLNLLFFACQISSNRAKLCQLGGVAVFFNMLKTSLSSINQLLKILEILVVDPNSQPYIAQSSEPIQLILGLMSGNKESLIELSPILPFLCHGNSEACNILANYFLTQINIRDIPNSISNASTQHIEKMLESLPATHSTLRDAFLVSGITAALCDSFRAVDPKTSISQTKFLLRILKGLIRSHVESQRLLDSKIIEKIFNLKNDPNDIGPCAECLIEAILQDPEHSNPSVSDLLQIMISDEEFQRKEKANKKREEILKQFPMPSLTSFGAMLDEEEGLACVICKEGYTLRPDDLLGFYIFVSSVPVVNPMNDVMHVMSIVTHFNPIHLQCHREAARAEKSMKKPKTEWEGATIRNQHTKCNNWFPIWGPQIPRHDYAGGVQWMFSSYPAIENRLCNEVYSLKLLLEKFCYEESFSKESRGGGPEHNMQAVPYMLQLIYYLLEEDKDYGSYMSDEKKDLCSKITSLKPEFVPYLMILIFVTGNYSEWVESKKDLIKSCWTVAKNNPRNDVKITYGQVGIEVSFEQKQVLSAFKPFLIGVRIIDLLYSVLFAGVTDIVANKAFLQSADPSIQERSLFIYEDYKKVSALASLQEIVAVVEPSLANINWLS